MFRTIINKPLYLFTVYLIIHLLIRLFFPDSIQVDDREQIFYAQQLHFGYLMPQPPLYSWLSWLFFQFLGPNIISLSVLKYSLILLTFIYITKISNYLFRDKELIVFSSYSFLLMPSFFWHMHQGFTHTILLGVGIVITIFYLLELNTHINLKSYFGLGVGLSIGFLSKYSFLIFFLIILLTIFFSKDYRSILFNKKIFISALVLFLATFPHYLWLSDNFHDIFLQANERLKVEKSIEFNIKHVILTLESFLGFISPLVLFLVPIFIKNFKNLIKQPEPNLVLFRNFYIVVLISLILFFIFFDIPHIKVRWLHPLMMIFPFWFFLEFKKKSFYSETFKKFLLALF